MTEPWEEWVLVPGWKCVSITRLSISPYYPLSPLPSYYPFCSRSDPNTVGLFNFPKIVTSPKIEHAENVLNKMHLSRMHTPYRTLSKRAVLRILGYTRACTFQQTICPLFKPTYAHSLCCSVPVGYIDEWARSIWRHRSRASPTPAFIIETHRIRQARWGVEWGDAANRCFCCLLASLEILPERMIVLQDPVYWFSILRVGCLCYTISWYTDRW